MEKIKDYIVLLEVQKIVKLLKLNHVKKLVNVQENVVFMQLQEVKELNNHVKFIKWKIVELF